MARVRFVSPSLSFDLTGSEESIEQRLRAMFGKAGDPEPDVPEVAVEAATPPSTELLEEFAVLLRAAPPRGPDAQRLAALRAAAFLAERGGHTSLRVADFVRAFLTARVDTRDVFKLLEELAAEGLFTCEREGGPYELA